MARVHYRKARKDYPDDGITKGDQYYYVKIKTGPRSSRVMRSLKPFKRSQLTQSEFYSQQFDLEDRLQELRPFDAELADAAQEIADEVRALGEEQEEKLQNMPDSLQCSPSGELLQERYDECNSWADEIESALGNLPEEVDEPEDEPEEPAMENFDSEEEYHTAFDEWEEEIAAWTETTDAFASYQSELEDAANVIKECYYNGG